MKQNLDVQKVVKPGLLGRELYLYIMLLFTKRTENSIAQNVKFSLVGILIFENVWNNCMGFLIGNLNITQHVCIGKGSILVSQSSKRLK